MQPSCLGYCAFEVSDLRTWETFGVQILGLQKGRCVEGESLALRLDEHQSRVLLYQGASDDLIAAGWEFSSEAELSSYIARLEDRGVKVEEGSKGLAAKRAVAGLFACSDPNGWTHEFYFGPEIAPPSSPFQSQLVRGGFESGPLGVGHIVTLTDDGASTNGFYKNVLGFSVSDSAHDQGLSATFFHVKAGRHHSVAVLEIPQSPKYIHHLMLQTKTLEDVGIAYDRLIENNVPILLSLGQHTNDQMISFYALTPSGFAVEFGWGGLVIDDESWTVKSYSKGSLWGHKPMLTPPVTP